MGMFTDFVRFMGSVLLGQKDASQAYAEALAMAERYVRWGTERGDIRDFRSAMDQLDLCRDADAPKSEFVVRKYAGLVNATSGILAGLIRKHKERVSEAGASQGKLSHELSALEGQIEVAKKRAEELKAEGSLIKAQDEERHLNEMRTRVSHLRQTLAAHGDRAESAESYEALVSESERLCENLEAGIVSLEMNPELPADVVGTVRDLIRDRLETMRSEVQALSPEMPPPAEEPEAAAQPGPAVQAEPESAPETE